MSILNQQFNQLSSCFDIRTRIEASKFDFVIKPSNSGTCKVEEQEKAKENDALLIEALNGLSFEEREEQQEELHGVDVHTADDESRFIDYVLRELDGHLWRIKHGTVYETAERMDPEYVHARSFRVMFLRGNRYDAKASADQMLKFFEWKQKLFGTEKLVKNITIGDLDEDDLACLRTGCTQFPGKDSSNRPILLHFPGLRSFRTLHNELRMRYFVWMKALESEESQLKGACVISYTVGNDFKEKKEGWGFAENARLSFALPVHLSAFHVCINDTRQYVLINAVIKMMPRKLRARFRLHLGSHMECQYALSTYGIGPESLPLTPVTFELDKEPHMRWLRSCFVGDTCNHSASLAQPQTQIQCQCSPNDVLYAGGKISNNAGNSRLRALVKKLYPIYDSGTRDKKRIVVDGMIGEIHKSGGRFLREAASRPHWWIEVPLDEVRSKITQMFRNHRRRPDILWQRKHGGVLITDVPLPNDVVFGKGHKSQGSELLHHLIREKAEEYDAMDRGMKAEVADAIVQEIKSHGGRFLQPAPEYDSWLEVSNEMARARVGKYFRNQRRRPAKKHRW